MLPYRSCREICPASMNGKVAGPKPSVTFPLELSTSSQWCAKGPRCNARSSRLTTRDRSSPIAGSGSKVRVGSRGASGRQQFAKPRLHGVARLSRKGLERKGATRRWRSLTVHGSAPARAGTSSSAHRTNSHQKLTDSLAARWGRTRLGARNGRRFCSVVSACNLLYQPCPSSAVPLLTHTPCRPKSVSLTRRIPPEFDRLDRLIRAADRQVAFLGLTARPLGCLRRVFSYIVRRESNSLPASNGRPLLGFSSAMHQVATESVADGGISTPTYGDVQNDRLTPRSASIHHSQRRATMGSTWVARRPGR